MASILLVEDDQEVRLLFKMVLEDAGHEVAEAINGTEALELYRKHAADVIVTDIIMPEKEGIQTIIELRNLNPRVKIIAMSGGGRGGALNYLELARKFGASIALAKPFSNEELLSAVQSVLEQT